ncbi:hypothetical protein [Seonamhaeicola sp. ML3]|uniref:hypothetical protein n=1 Tax=Seonamhaeicola sp. ML3 TaxID=2937786 RepID=UPI00200D2929|nr:hypothetical protein [Seonamhaeicola sp. ML3]
MKKLSIISFLLLLLYAPLFSQENDRDISSTNNSSEIKLNGLFLILGAFEGTYEYILNEESAVGVSVFLPFDNDVRDEAQYYILPYYRMYFGRKKNASGFFAEGFGMLNSLDRSISFISSSGDDYKTDFAVGFAIGSKWVTSRGVSFELLYGIGRNLFQNDDSDYAIVPRFGFNFGYRF